MRYKVSVIVPVYNAAEYIERCVRSLMSQTLREIEYIFIDDCSKDGGMTVLERTLTEFPERAGDVRILRHEVNRGVAISRVEGLDIARGDYVAYCDSDDWVDTRMYEKMYQALVSEGADLCLSDFLFVNHDGMVRAGLGFEKGLGKEDIVRQCCLRYPFTTVWSLMATRDLFNSSGARLSAGITFAEDLFMAVCLHTSASKIVCVREPLYYYNMLNPSSIVHTLSERKFMGEIDCCVRLADRLKEQGIYKTYRKEMEWRMLKCCAWLIFQNRFDEFRKYVPGVSLSMLTVPGIFCDRKAKVMILLTALHLDFICRWDNKRHGRF